MPTYYVDCHWSSRCLAQFADIRNVRSFYDGVSWVTLHDASAGTTVDQGRASVVVASATDKWGTITRLALPFVTTGLPAEITRAKIRMYIQSWPNSFSSEAQAAIYGYTPGDPGDHVVGDYDQFGSVPFSNLMPQSSWIAGWNIFSLNASGLAAIVEGVSKFALRIVWDGSNSPPTWEAFAGTAINVSYNPQLIVNYTFGYIWVEGTKLAYLGICGRKRLTEGTLTGDSGDPGYAWVDGIYQYYTEETTGDVRRIEGTLTGLTGETPGQISINTKAPMLGTHYCYIDDTGAERCFEGT